MTPAIIIDPIVMEIGSILIEIDRNPDDIRGLAKTNQHQCGLSWVL